MPANKHAFSISENSNLRQSRRGKGIPRHRGKSPATGGGAPPAGGSLKVTTTGIRPGYLRKNGYPYSGKTTVTEFYDRTTESNGDSWLIVTTIVNDPVYLNQEFITSTHFKREADAKNWNPQPCTARQFSRVQDCLFRISDLYSRAELEGREESDQ